MHKSIKNKDKNLIAGKNVLTLVEYMPLNQGEFSILLGKKSQSAVSQYGIRGIDEPRLIHLIGIVRDKFKINLKLEHFELPVEQFSEMVAGFMRDGEKIIDAESEAAAYRMLNPACPKGEPAGEKSKLKKKSGREL